MTAFPHLFSPCRLGRLTLANRTVVGPMTRVSATPSGEATPPMASYYARFARGGFGLIISEATYIDEEWSQGYLNQPGLANDRQVEAWKPIVGAIHDAGAPVLAQLIHAGGVNQGNAWVEGSIAPSGLPPKGEQLARYGGAGPFQTPRAMTNDDIARVVEAFAQAARRAVAAGFDGVEIHGANGYLIDQFLTDGVNQRTDEWGGPIENRVRFALAVTRAVRDALPSDIPVGIRISQTKVNDLTHTWPGGAQDAQAIFSALGTIAGIFVHANAHAGIAPVFGTPLSMAGLAKKWSGHPVIACGKLEDPSRAEAVLAAGETDLVAIAKGALGDPAWPAKVKRGETPRPFDPAIISPLATLANSERWEREQANAAG